MKSIILINVFFGKFPWYFNLFLKSCETNPTVSFILFTDNETKIKLPENVKLIKFSLNEFNQLATEKIGFEIMVSKPYKLCDFKPAYGMVFSDYLKDYEYWGMTDIDLIFGRIREFITDEMLNEYEVISVRNDYPTGSFMIFKNNDKLNNLFKKSKDWEKVFKTEKHYCFDECNFEHQYLENGGDIFEVDTEIESMQHILKREVEQNKLKVHYDFLIIEGLPGKLFWDNGFLSFKNEFEVLLYHLILYKGNQYSLKENWKNIPNQFFIDKYQIRKKGIIPKLNFFYNEVIRVFFIKTFINLDFFLSQKIFCKSAKKINICKYNNGNQNRYISENEENELVFSFFEEQSPMMIYESILQENTFFIDKVSQLFYKIIDEKSIIEISIDGSTFKLEKV